MSLYNKLVDRREKISLIGLGYVGIPIALAFAKKFDVIGFDLSIEKINLYRNGIDPTCEVGDNEIKRTTVYFTSREEDLKKAKFHIITVPTPVNLNHIPDLSSIELACKILGRNLSNGSIVVFESTVYPGVTEDICIPILEKESGLKCGLDFKVGYSPERINPGDKEHKFENIKKIVSGIDKVTLNEIKNVYDSVIEVGTYSVSSIKTAEAIKIAENSQRDINIAFMNELSMIFDRMGIDTNEVIDGMNTKWNALKFRPGLVGGHCIGVDPYYFTYKAEKLGYHSQIILNGRIVNDGMGNFIGDIIIKKLIESGKKLAKSKVAILGITFKENCNDIRNTKVNDIIKKLKEYGVNLVVYDPLANKDFTKAEYNVDLIELNDIKNMDCIVLAVAHNKIKNLTFRQINSMFNLNLPNDKKILIDIKGIKNKKYIEKKGLDYWRL